MIPGTNTTPKDQRETKSSDHKEPKANGQDAPVIYKEAADSKVWSVSYPPMSLSCKTIQLLTIGNVIIKGRWSGKLGEFYSAWAPL